jgi:hypothetical protein
MVVFMSCGRKQESERCVSSIVVSLIIDLDVLLEGFGVVFLWYGREIRESGRSTEAQG